VVLGTHASSVRVRADQLKLETLVPRYGKVGASPRGFQLAFPRGPARWKRAYPEWISTLISLGGLQAGSVRTQGGFQL
jgi:hypothetical protein